MAKITFQGPGGRLISECVDIEDNAQAQLNLTTTVASTNGLSEGVYDAWSSVDCYIGVGIAGAADKAGLSVDNGYFLKAGNTVPVMVREQSCLFGIVEVGTGKLRYHRVM